MARIVNAPARESQAPDTPLLVEDAPAETALQVQTPVAVSMFERLVKDPNVDVDKLERLIAMQERVMRHTAKAAFDAAFSKMQSVIPVVDEHGRIEVGGTLRSTYAPLEDIHKVIKPILANHGFSVRHRTEWPADRPGIIRIVGILSHEQGHSEESVFEAPADRHSARSDIQSMGSTVSYGRRYTTMDLLNIATKKADNDGQKRSGGGDAPKDYEPWWTDLQAVAQEGIEKLMATFRASKPEFKTHLVNQNKDGWKALQDRARGVKA